MGVQYLPGTLRHPTQEEADRDNIPFTSPVDPRDVRLADLEAALKPFANLNAVTIDGGNRCTVRVGVADIEAAKLALSKASNDVLPTPPNVSGTFPAR